MKLFTTPTSPYGRLVRIVIAERGLVDRVEVMPAQTRTPGSSYYKLNPSGRVPYLVRGDGPSFEDSQLICLHLDRLDGRPRLHLPPEHQDWHYGRLESYARSMLDGLSVFIREMRRPEHERSPTIVRHETDRATRLADHWDGEVDAPLMQRPLNMAQLLLIVALDVAAASAIGSLEKNRPRLGAWAAAMRLVPSVRATAT